MKTLLFRNGDQMPALGLGTWKSAGGQVYTAVRTALECGYRHIDCAPIYGNEAEVGKAFSESFENGVVSREDVWVTSKLWNNAHIPEAVEPALRKTLTDLQVEYLDLFLIHWPVHIQKGLVYPSRGEDYIAYDQIPVTDTWQAMEELVDKGLCRHIGVSNFSTVKLTQIAGKARIIPEMNQVELHPYLQQPGMVSYCQTNSIHLTAYAPLGSPDRPDALKAADEPILLQDPVIRSIAEHHSVSEAQVLLAWALQRNTAVIPKSVTPTRIEDNLKSAELVLSKEEVGQINGLNRNRRYVAGEFWCGGGSPYSVNSIWDGE